MPIMLGIHSPELDAVRALRTKAGRSEQRRYAIEGSTLLDEALRALHQAPPNITDDALRHMGWARRPSSAGPQVGPGSGPAGRPM